MSTTVKALQWNIGAGKIRKVSDDPLASSSYSTDSLENIIELLHSENPDIITLQETHADDSQDQVAQIAEALGYNYFTSNYYSDSHITPGKKLGQGIISRLPMSSLDSTLLVNPLFEVTWKNGITAVTHDKGITSCVVMVDGVPLVIKTLHLIPFDPFKIDPLSDAARAIFQDVQGKLLDSSKHILIQGDLNLGSRNPPTGEVMPALAQAGMKEIEHLVPTIPYGEWPDRILYKGLRPLSSRTLDDVLTDHYPVVTLFSLED